MICGKRTAVRSLSILGLFLLLSVRTVYAEQAMLVGSDAGRTYHVLCLDAGAPYIFRAENGDLQGVYVDILSALGEREGLKLSLSLGDTHDARRGIHLSRIDFIVGTPYPVPADSELFTFFSVKNMDTADTRLIDDFELMKHRLSGKEFASYCFSLPFFEEPYTLFAAGSEALPLSSLRGKILLVIEDSPEERHIRASAFNVKILQEDTMDSAVHSLLANKGDAALLGAYQGIRHTQNLPQKGRITPSRPFFFSLGKGITVMKGQADLALAMMERLSAMKQSGEISKITGAWLSQYDPPVLSRQEIWNIVGGGLLALFAALLWNLLLKRKVGIMVKEREKILDFIKDGILAVDNGGRITILNRSAQNLLGLSSDSIGKEADLCIPGLAVGIVLTDGRPVYNLQQNLNGALVSCNKVPILEDSHSSGVIITLRDMSELQAMAEEITGVRTYVETLRVQGHEFMNKLQTISGLIQLQRYDRAIEFIASETDSSLSAQAFLAERIKNAAVCGIIMGKAGRCRELGIAFILDPESFCCDHGESINDRSLVIIIGNLLQNAIEAVVETGVTPDARIEFSIFDESGQILIDVFDNAGIMTEEAASRLFEKGFTTKYKAEPSGFGLFNIKTIVDSLAGNISMDFETGRFTEFTVTLPVTAGALRPEVAI